MDWPLFLTACLFFIISWPYAWGLLHFFGDNFHWDKAAVIGILFVTSGTYTFVWTIRRVLGVELTPVIYEQCVYDLFIVFSAALPGMMLVRYRLIKRQSKCIAIRNKQINELIEANTELQKKFDSIYPKKNTEQQMEQQIRSLNAILKSYESKLNITPKQAEFIIPTQPEGLKAS